MGLFGSAKPRVTKEELHRAIFQRLPHLNYKQRKFLEEFFEDDVDEKFASEKGLDADEITKRMESLHSTQNMHHISEGDLVEVEKVLRSML